MRRWRWGLPIVVACAGSAPARPPAAARPAPPADAGATGDADAPRRQDAAPPPVATDDVVETIAGITVRDPYRWMERGGAAFDAHLEAADHHARALLAGLPGRDALAAELHANNRGVGRAGVIAVVGRGDHPRLFLSRRGVDDEVATVWLRDGWTGAERLLLDPRTRDADGVHHAIDYSAPSPDGRYLAYGISASGSEDSTIEILDVARGVVLPERIDRAQYASLHWRDATSFYYWRRAAPAPGAPRADWFKHSATYLHVLGDDPARARPVFGPDLPGLDLPVEAFSNVDRNPASPWAVATGSPGTSADPAFFVAPVAKVVPGTAIPWRRITRPTDEVVDVTPHGGHLYALTYAGAPRFRILELDARRGTLATARVFVAESAAVIEGMAAADDGLYLRLLDHGVTRITRVTWDGRGRDEVPLPAAGAASFLTAYDRPGVVLTTESWTRPPTTFAWQPPRRRGAGTLTDLALTPPWPPPPGDPVVEEVTAPSADGTEVPLSIVRPRALAADAAALLEGYAAYGAVARPFYSPIRLTWVAHGGVYAVCHARGGGDLGKPWHLGGKGRNKERGVEDFLACAGYLVDHQLTTAGHLVATGTSAGGVLVGGALTRAPARFAAVLLRVAMLDLSRFEQTEGGPANVPEFGSVADLGDPEGARALIASDPYHRIVVGTRYPAVLMTCGRHDVRVPSWQPAKFAARLAAATAGDRPIALRVEGDGGHGIGATRAQAEAEWADLFAVALAAVTTAR